MRRARRMSGMRVAAAFSSSPVELVSAKTSSTTSPGLPGRCSLAARRNASRSLTGAASSGTSSKRWRLARAVRLLPSLRSHRETMRVLTQEVPDRAVHQDL